MDKEQALQSFWSSFGVPAYNENSVRADATFPRITYPVAIGSLNYPVSLTAKISDNTTSWTRIRKISHLIAETISRGGIGVDFDGGRIWITPRGQIAADMPVDKDNDSIREIQIFVNAEFLSEV